MHMRIYISALLFSFISLFFSQTVLASEFTLTHIGAMETKGVRYNQWWYEPQQVVLKGTGSKLANIDITLDGRTQTIKSDSEGIWSHNLGTLDIADHQVQIGSGTDLYSFVLTIGSSPPADMNSTKGGLPEAGIVGPLVGIVGIGALLVLYSFKRKEA